MRIDLHVYNVFTYIRGMLPPEIEDELDYFLSFEVMGASFSPQYRVAGWDGRRRFFSQKLKRFPTGLTKKAVGFLQERGIDIGYIDFRKQLPSQPPLPVLTPLYPWQNDILDIVIPAERGIMQVATAGGKTLLFAHLIGRLNQNSLVLVHNTSIFEQVTEVLSNNLNVPIGQIGGGKFNPQKITVGMVQTLIRSVDPKFSKTKEADWDEEDNTETDPVIVRKLLADVYVLCADETHRIAARTAYRVQQECKNARYRIGASATPWRFDRADMLIEAAMGPKLVEYSAKKLIAMGYLAVPTFYCVKFRHHKVPSSMRYGELYSREIVNNDERNKIACFQAAKFASQGKVILLAVTHINHGKLLYKMLHPTIGDKLVFISGSVKSEGRLKILKKLNQRELLVGISTAVFGEGVNIPNLDAIINLKAQDSSVDAVQLVGRALRKTDTKTKALVIDFWDYGCRFLEKHFKNRLLMYEQELGVKMSCVNQSNALC